MTFLRKTYRRADPDGRPVGNRPRLRGRPGKDSKKKATSKIGEIVDLAGHKVGIIRRTGANVALLRTIVEGSGVQPDKVATAQFGKEIEKLAQDRTVDAYLNAKPAWPEDKVDTISVNHLILARKELSEAKAAAFYRQLFAVREALRENWRERL